MWHVFGCAQYLLFVTNLHEYVLAIRDEFLKIKCELSFLLIKSFMHVSKNQIYESVRTNFFHRWDLFFEF